ncbi:MAG: hypothetical protein FWD44_07700 [Oscillospiraceae bacterium]|nr:hypothetical protein [Oscillospiraceae bacterium]
MPLIELLSDVSWISIVLFVVGIALVIIEMLDPGFGFFGAFGILTLVGCIFVTANTVAEGIMLTIIFSVILLIMLAIFMILVSKGKLPNKFILKDAETKDQGYIGTEDLNSFMCKKGIVTAACRPVGNADFDGVKLEVVSRGEFIDKGITIEVIEIEGNRVVVRSILNNNT